jgi:hypothetical protein
MGIASATARTRVLDALLRDLVGHDYANTTGDVGFRFLLRALADSGHSDIIYRMVNQDEKPGYGYQLKQGATSLTEAWDANLVTSHNHFMLGQVTEWFYHDLAGISADLSSPGFKHIVISPQPVGDLTWVDAGYISIHGPINVRWERKAQMFILKVSIPANTTATVVIPARTGTPVWEGGTAVTERPSIKTLRREGTRAFLEIESGTYVFESQWP